MNKNQIIDGYQDRGMAKWGGFYLSEHSSEIAKDKKKRSKKNEAKERMTTEEIDQVLYEAQLYTQLVCIQIEMKDSDGNYLDDIIGFISAFDTLGIWLGETKVEFDEIRNVSVTIYEKWSKV